MIAARILRRLARKLAKPAALWWNERALREAEDQADFFLHVRLSAGTMHRMQTERAIQLAVRRSEITGW